MTATAAPKMSSSLWESLDHHLSRVGDLLLELHYVDAAIDHFGEDLVFGHGDATATFTVTLGWTHPYAHTFVRPIVDLGGSGNRDADVRRELDGILATSRTWASAQMAEFTEGLTTLLTANPDAMADAAMMLAEMSDLLDDAVNTDLSMLDTSLSNWYGDARTSFIGFVGGLSTSREVQATLAGSLAVGAAGGAAAICTARTSVVRLLVATAQGLDLQLQERADRATQTSLDGLRIAMPVMSAVSGLVSLVPGGQVAGTILSSVTSLLALVVDNIPDTETVDLDITSAPVAASLLFSTRARIFDNRDSQFDLARDLGPARVQRILTGGGYADLTPPRPDLADHPVDADALHHESSESY